MLSVLLSAYATAAQRFFDGGRWVKAEPAADLDAPLVRPSRNVCDALVAAGAEVTLFGATCESALPAADFEAAPVLLPERVLDAALAALAPVTSPEPAFLAAADCARAAKLPFATPPPNDFAVAL